ncbi:MAG: glycosyl transferase family 6 [Alphaproteobacteria bacterium]|nr:glycosyl transferase family 6 [Alphaproteobacteria bacterium]
MAKIGILYIATGRYITFWNEFYKRCEKFFCNDHQKQYFLFTDANNVSVKNNVKIIQHKYLGWPEETLMRFDTFLKVENDLQKMDYIYFFNANLYPVRKIKGEEVFPSFEQQIMVTLHPAFYNMPRKIFTYENNEKSSAYVPFPLGEYYVCGGFNGGIAEYYLKLINDLDKAVKNDLKNGIIAVWHDESHLNRYILDRNPLILSAKYVIPEVIGFNQKNLKSLKPKMILIDKMSPICGGHDYMRGLTDKRIKNNFINRFKWWLHKKRTNKKNG